MEKYFGQVDDTGEWNGIARLETQTSLYEGQMVFIRTGFGREIFSNGDYYIGEYDCDKINGYGKMYYNEGTFKEGIWKNGVFVDAVNGEEEEDNFKE